MALPPTLKVTFLIRRDTASNWAFVNPILKIAEPALETDTRKIKFGDGTTPWVDLPYISMAALTDTEANWAADNPVLLLGEPGFEIDTNRIKYGNGVDAWNDLPYMTRMPVGGLEHEILKKVSDDDFDVAWAALTAGTVEFTPVGTISATDVQGAIAELAAEKVQGPGASTDQAIVRWDGTGGFQVQNSGVVIDGSDNIIGAATITVDDDAYGAGWNGSLQVPTKNAVYDKIEDLVNSALITDTGTYVEIKDGSGNITGQLGGTGDPGNYWNNTTHYFRSRDGSTTFISFSGTLFTSNVPISVPGDAYGPGWNGSTQVPTKDAIYDKIESMSGGGDVTGPGSSTDNTVVRWNGTAGTSIQGSGVVIDDSNNLSGVAGFTCSGFANLNGGFGSGAFSSVTGGLTVSSGISISSGALTSSGSGSFSSSLSASSFTTSSFSNFAGGFTAGLSSFSGQIFPTSDNAISCGNGSNRWSVIYAGTGTINTSDERHKKFRPGTLTPQELKAARRIMDELNFFQWLQSVKEKKGDARWHFGASAQRVMTILMEEGLENSYDLNLDKDLYIPEADRPNFRTAFLCFDTWEDQYQEVPVAPKITHLKRPKKGQHPVKVEERPPERRLTRGQGNMFGLRVDQLTLFLLAAQEQRLRALEAKMLEGE